MATSDSGRIRPLAGMTLSIQGISLPDNESTLRRDRNTA